MMTPLHFVAWLMALGLGLLPVARLAAAETPMPELSLSLRGVGDDTIEQGEPLRITVRLSVPHKSTGEITLAPPARTWSDAIAVELASANDGAVVARGTIVGQPTTPHATVGAGKIAGGLWVIASTAMQPLAPGDYVVRARLVINGGSGWNGAVDTDEIPLRVVIPSGAAYRVAQRSINLAHEALLAGHLEAAVSIIDPLLQNAPDDGRLLAVRADLAMRAGNSLAALLCLNRAKRMNPSEGAGPPPLEREELESRARASLQGEKMPATNPPVWSWPPAAVLALPETEFLAQAELKGEASAALSEQVPAAATVAASAPMKITAVAPAPMPAVSVGGKFSGVLVPSAELIDAQLIADPAGQWAVMATASSQYDQVRYAPAQATGAPNIALGMAGDNPDAWCPAAKNEGTAWLEVTFEKPVHATEVRVRQNNAPGAITKIEAIASDGTVYVWWEGVDPFVAPAVREIAWFAVRVPQTSYLVAKVKITLDLVTVPGWKQIDAVQLVGVAQ